MATTEADTSNIIDANQQHSYRMMMASLAEGTCMCQPDQQTPPKLKKIQKQLVVPQTQSQFTPSPILVSQNA